MWKRRRIKDRTEDLGRPKFQPQTIAEAKKALDLGLIDIAEYVEVSLSMEPVVDALSDPDPAVRRAAVAELAKHPNRKWAVSKLRELLTESDAEMYLYVAETLEKLDSRYLKLLYKLEKELKGSSSPKSERALALLCLEYAQTGLAGAALAQSYLRRGEHILSQLIEELGASTKDLCARGRVRLASGQTREAINDFKLAIQLDPSYETAFLGLAEAYYRLGDYHSIEHSCKYVSQVRLPEELQETVEFWLSP